MFEVLVSGLLFSHLYFFRDLPRASALQGGRWRIHFIGAQINKVPIALDLSGSYLYGQSTYPHDK